MALTEAQGHHVWPYSEGKLNPYPISNSYCWHPVVLYDAVLRYEGRYDSKSSYFFLKKYNYNYNTIYIYQGYTLYSVEIIFTQSPSLSIHFIHPSVERSMPPASNLLLKRRSSTRMLCYRSLSSSSSVKRRPRSVSFRGSKIWKS